MAEWKSASWKQEEDFSGPATELLGRINAVEVPVLLRSTTRSVDSYIEELLALEKRSRFGGDTLTTQRLAVEAVRILRVLGEYSKMLDLIAALFRKRGQMKQVQTAMVWEAARPLKLPGWQLPAAPIPSSGDAAKAAEVQKTDTSDATSEDAALSDAQRQELLSRLKFQCEGKIHLELEHARLCEQLALIAEAEGRKREASDLLFGIQVETITNMPRLEKIQSVLSQLKLALENNDDGRVVVLSRKLNPRALGKDDTRRHKIDYFLLLAEYNERHKNWLVQARCWLEIYEALEARDAAAAKAGAAASEDAAAAGPAQKDGADWKFPFTAIDALSNAVVLALVAGHVPAKELDDQQEFIAFNKSTAFTTRHHLLVQLAARKALQPELPQLALLVKRFLGGDLIREAALPIVEAATASHPLLSGSQERKEALLARLCEHDLVVVSRFYRRVRIERLAELVGLTPARAEEFIMQLVDAGQLQAVFDRVLGVVAFDRKKANPTDVLEKWNARVEHTAALVERLAQLIAKERMLYAAVGAVPSSPVKA